MISIHRQLSSTVDRMAQLCTGYTPRLLQRITRDAYLSAALRMQNNIDEGQPIHTASYFLFYARFLSQLRSRGRMIWRRRLN